MPFILQISQPWHLRERLQIILVLVLVLVGQGKHQNKGCQNNLINLSAKIKVKYC